MWVYTIEVGSEIQTWSTFGQQDEEYNLVFMSLSLRLSHHLGLYQVANILMVSKVLAFTLCYLVLRGSCTTNP